MKKLKIEVIDSLLKNAGEHELRARVDAHCVSCIYDELGSGTWRQQVEKCCVTSCPLFDVRVKSRSIAAESKPMKLDGVLVPLEDVSPDMQRFDYILKPKCEDRESDS